MATPSRWQYLIPATMMIAAALVYGWAAHQSTRYKWTPVDIPFPLQAGSFKNPVFHVDLAATYVIYLSAERNLPLRELNCLLGIEKEGEKHCHETPSPLSVSWQVFARGDSVASGTSEKSKGGAWGTKVKRTIGMFRAEPNVDYTLEVHSHKNAISLQKANPHLLVSASPVVFKNYFATSSLIAMLGLFLGAIGGIWLLISVIRFFLSRRKNAP